MIRGAARDIIARILLATGGWRWVSPGSSRDKYCLIVNFHSIVDRQFLGIKRGPSVHTPVEAFETFLNAATKIFDPISLDDLVDHLDSGIPLQSNRIAITFDDGFRNNLLLAAPVLKKLGCPATVFLAVDYVGENRMLPIDRVSAFINQSPENAISIDLPRRLVLPCGSPAEKSESLSLMAKELKALPAERWEDILEHMGERAGIDAPIADNPMLTWDEAGKLIESQVDIGSHGCTHRLMTAIRTDAAVEEMERSRDRIAEKLGLTPNHFAYPNGRDCDFNDELRHAARNAGYRSVLSCERRITVPGRSRSDRLGRFGLVGRPAHSMLYLLRSASRQLA